MNERGEPVVRVDEVTKRYGDVIVLDRVSFALQRGEFVALTGPSGAGKSTLIHLMGALEPPDSGTITVDGVTIAHHSHANLSRFRRQKVGIVFQLHNLIPRLTAAQNIELAMFATHRSRTERCARAAELLERLNLEEIAQRRPPQMSGGERARVALARGLANEPPVVLADEPTGNLDDRSAELVIDQLRSLAQVEGRAVLCVSHDARLDVQAHRTIQLHDGKVTPSGAAQRADFGALDTPR